MRLTLKKWLLGAIYCCLDGLANSSEKENTLSAAAWREAHSQTQEVIIGHSPIGLAEIQDRQS